MEEALRSIVGNFRLKQNEKLEKYTSLHIGAEATFVADGENEIEIQQLIALAKEYAYPYCIIGTGTNTLFPDEHLTMLVIRNNCRRIEVAQVLGKIVNRQLGIEKAYIAVEAGALVSQIVRFTIEEGYKGLETFLGIRGTLSDVLLREDETIRTKLAQSIHKASVLTYEGEVKDVDKFYFTREKTAKNRQEVVLSVLFELFPGDKKQLWEVANQAATTYAAQLPDEQFYGKMFYDISYAQALSIPTPSYHTEAAYFIEKAVRNTKNTGNVIISNKNPNYVVNKGNATAGEVQELLQHIKKDVYQTFQVKLEPFLTTIQ